MEWYLLIIIASLVGAISVISRKKVLFHEHALEFSGFRSVVNLFFLVILLFFIDLKIDTTNVFLLLVCAVLASLGIIYRNKATRHDEISEIAPLGSLSGLFVLFLGIIFLAEIPGIMQYVGIFVSILGVYLLEVIPGDVFGPFKKLYNKKAVKQYGVALIFFSIATIIIRSVVSQVHPLTTMFYLWLMISVMIIAYDFKRNGLKDIKDFKTDFWMIFMTAFFLFIANILFYYGLSYPAAQASLAHTLRLSGNIFATFIGGKMFREDHYLKKSIASIIILIGAVLIIL